MFDWLRDKESFAAELFNQGQGSTGITNDATGDVQWPENPEDLREQLDEARQKMDALHRRCLDGTAAALVDAGISLIPCENLRDNQLMVSPAIFAAAMRYAKSQAAGQSPTTEDAE